MVAIVENRCSQRRGRAPVVALIFIASIVCVIGLGLFTLTLRPDARRTESSAKVLRVYCAAGVVAPIEEIIETFNSEFGTNVEITRIGGSGELAGQLQTEFESNVEDAADIIISADEELLKKAQRDKIVAEMLPIARQRPVIAIRADSRFDVGSLKQLVTQSDYSFGIASSQAAIGKMTRQIAERDGFATELAENRKTDTENVMTLAQALLAGSLDAAVLWDTTVHLTNEQQGEEVLSIVAPADRNDLFVSHIGLGVVTRCQSPTLGLKFARYLTAPETGAAAFQEFGFETVTGDRWEEVPEIHLYCGSMFTPVLEQRVRQFAVREGVNIYAKWEGCGKLVAAMQSLSDPDLFPDAYLACDVSFLEQVQERFGPPVTIASNQVVLAVRKDTTKQVLKPTDLLQSGLRVGICDPDQSALGSLTKEILLSPPYESLYEDLAEHAVVSVDVGPTLISQLMAGGLDVAVVYNSNVMSDPNVTERVNVITIESSSSAVSATQPWAVSKETANPYLMKRLYDTIVSRDSITDFTDAGFEFKQQPE